MLLEVVPQTLLELLFTDHRIDHTDNAATFAIRYGIENLLDLLSMPNRHLNWMAAPQCIQLQSPLLLCAYVRLPDLPLRMQGVRRERLHPICKAFVKPQVVPPLHGDQIAKPLVSKLMGDDRADPLLLRRGDCLLVAQERYFAVRHQAPILHRPCGKVWNCDHVHLRERVGDAEEFVVKLQGIDAAPERVAASVGASRAAKYPGQCAILGRSPNVLELANAESEEIGAHLRCRHEDVHPLTIFFADH
mmetsp:Transcript_98792/g.247629  ORF Transcript_98792/g.247629 Transcript_98792/m.247629 type:complete len:247 (+) Transcript_98792:1519-2259(+)